MSEIPEAAVSAVAIAVFETRDDPYDTNEWEDLDSTERERWECYARAALEAAAPIIRTRVIQESVNPEGTKFTLVNGWLVREVNDCTCYGGGPYGHEPGCGYELELDLTEQVETIRANERKKIAEEIRVEMRRHDSAQVGFSAIGDAYAHAARIAERGGK